MGSMEPPFLIDYTIANTIHATTATGYKLLPTNLIFYFSANLRHALTSEIYLAAICGLKKGMLVNTSGF